MSSLSLDRRLPDGFLAESLRADAYSGLTSAPKVLPPKWFYDAQGSALFDKITELPEYYPTRAEREILRAQAAQIAGASGARTLVELGSGSSDKTRLLLDALREAGTLRCYVPVDVSEPALVAAGDALTAEYPGLDVRAVVSDFEEHLGFPADGDAPAPRLVAFLGSTIGNLLPDQRTAFLARVRAGLRPGDAFLLGTDLVKDPGTLVAAYDDDSGVTAAFNKNVLAVLNAELGADFDTDEFEHVALWDPAAEWIEMRLRSLAEQTVHVPAIGLTVDFAAGEEMRTEVSAKFRRGGVAGRTRRRRVRDAVLVDRSGRAVRPVAVGSRLGPADPFQQADGHGVAHLLADGLADVRLDRELVGAVAEGHERAAERVAVDGPAHLDQAAGAEERHRFGPHDVGPAALCLALPQGRGELLVHDRLPRVLG